MSISIFISSHIDIISHYFKQNYSIILENIGIVQYRYEGAERVWKA